MAHIEIEITKLDSIAKGDVLFLTKDIPYHFQGLCGINFHFRAHNQTPGFTIPPEIMETFLPCKGLRPVVPKRFRIRYSLRKYAERILEAGDEQEAISIIFSSDDPDHNRGLEIHEIKETS